MNYDAGDKEQFQRLSKKAKLNKDREKEDLRALLERPGNRAVLWRILSRCGVYQDNPFPDSPGSMARHEGKRSIGLWLLQEIENADPRAFGRMRAEAAGSELNLEADKE
jgi:hypothetical protein